MAHKDRDEKLRKIKFQTPKIIKIVIWGVIAIIISISIGIWIWTVAKKESKETKTSAVAAQTATDYPLCADGEYDFSNLDIKKVGEVIVKVSTTCLANVVLPDSCWQSDPSVDVEKIWADGSKSYDGPNMVVIGKNNRKRIFFVRGLRESGIMKITFEKQN